MATATNTAMTPAERQAARRARITAEGGGVVTIALTKQARRALDRLTRDGTTATDALNALLAATTKRR